jgi:hypothetical protein
MEWQHSASPHPAPRNFDYKNLLEEFLSWIFGIKTASSSLIIFQRAKLSMWSITYLCWCNWRTFWRKINVLQEGHQGGLVLAWQCPSSPGTLFSGSGPVGLPTVPWTEKTNERSPFFIWRTSHCCHRDLVRRTTFWISLVAYKSYSNGLRSVLSFVGSMLNKSWVWSL